MCKKAFFSLFYFLLFCQVQNYGIFELFSVERKKNFFSCDLDVGADGRIYTNKTKKC